MSDDTQVTEGGGTKRIRNTNADVIREHLREFELAKVEGRAPSAENIAEALEMKSVDVLRQRLTKVRKIYPDLPKFPRQESTADPNLYASILAEVQAEVSGDEDEDETTDES
jgi:hypothetical protein